MKVGCQRQLAVVVIHFAAIQQRMLHRQVKQVCVRIAVARLRCGKVGIALRIDNQVDYGMFDPDVVQVPLLVHNRNYAHACTHVIDLQHRLSRARTDTVHRKSIKIESQIREVQREVLQRHPRVQLRRRFLFRRADHVIVERGAMQQHDDHDQRKDIQQPEDCQRPADNLSPSGMFLRRHQIGLARLARRKSKVPNRHN